MSSTLSTLRNVVIAGASVAGLSAADALRQGGFDGSITILSDERTVPYDRPPLSKELLAADGEPAAVELRPQDHYAAHELDLRLGHAAAGLDIDRRYVVTSDGAALPWDAVVIATGSRPRPLLTTSGAPLPVLRTMADLVHIRDGAARYGRVTLVGASFIGLEIAASLRRRGVPVTLFGAAELPLDNVVGPEVAADVRDLHDAHGVDLRLGALVTAVEGAPGDYTLRLSDGTTHRAPFVVAGVGVEPNVEWLLGSGVVLDGGVACDAAGRTNVPGVWAAGDVAAYDHPLLGARVRIDHWTSAGQQGRHVAGGILSGTATPFTSVPYYWTDQYDRKFHCYGRRLPEDEAFVAEGSLASGEYLVLYGSDGEFHSVLSSGRERSLRGYRKLLERRGTWADALELAGGNLQSAHA
ncbi:FAD-dependent oxidoreductase [Georgenia sp. EYE_87]|uniref:NAD(P)/FAD-dependent oxidoreductase n=1 Tax=Georgenia sp. EYE_87 TaxID=2853448 RepID=UPI0020053C69|nr:FAD-dependent oxidoreductase [Georgenia sp. EYE_87]MCK6208953.1 FAD-dependent oxidoreductase [Georgenia sp. EYE_87]